MLSNNMQIWITTPWLITLYRDSVILFLIVILPYYQYRMFTLDNINKSNAAAALARQCELRKSLSSELIISGNASVNRMDVPLFDDSNITIRTSRFESSRMESVLIRIAKPN